MAREYRPKERAEIARNMAAIRSQNNRTEVALRKTLHAMGFRYRKYSPNIIGKPDIIFPRERIAIFVDGDYWHGRLLRERGLQALKQYYTREQRKYWIAKLQRNIARDDRITSELRSDGWLVMRFWESNIKREVRKTALKVASAVRRRRRLAVTSLGKRRYKS